MAVAFTITSSPLTRLTQLVSSRQQPWEGLYRANVISEADLKLIQPVQPQGQPVQGGGKKEDVVSKDLNAYASLYTKLLKLQRKDTLQTVLVFVGDFLEPEGNTDAAVVRERVSLLLSTSDSPYTSLIPLLSFSDDDFIPLKSASILALLITSDPSPVPDSVIRPLLTHLAKLARHALPGQSNGSTLAAATSGGGNGHGGLESTEGDVGVQALRTVLTRREVRKAAWKVEEEDVGDKKERVIPTLVLLLRAGDPSPDLQYYIGFSFWLLSFESEIAEGLNAKYKVIPSLIQLAREASKEKVVRVILAAFRNLVQLAPSQNLPAMLVSRLLPFINSLSNDPKLADDEVKDDVEYLRGKLAESEKGLSSYDEYLNELKSGQLTWSPGHESEEFWRENAEKLNDKDYENLKKLIDLLKTSSDPQVLAIAANDVGQYVKYSEVGKKKATDLGAKTRVMELMSHEDAQVKYRALLTTQLLISQSWN